MQYHSFGQLIEDINLVDIAFLTRLGSVTGGWTQDQCYNAIP